jgi:signal transduction histidine kinase
MRARAQFAEERAAKLIGQLELTQDTDALRQLDALERLVPDAVGRRMVEDLRAAISEDRARVDTLSRLGAGATADQRDAESRAYADIRDHFLALRDQRDRWLAEETLSQNISRAISLGFIGLTIFGVVGGFWFAIKQAGSIAKRVTRVAENADAVARGESVSIVDDSGDEIGALARRLHQLQLTLRQREQQAARRAHELAALNQELEAFSYSVSHDLRAPLRAIAGFSQIIEEDHGERLDDSGRDALRRIRGGADRMGVLIDQLLGLSRYSRAPLAPAQVDVSQMVEAVVADLRQADPARVVTVEVEPNLVAFADPGLLRVVLDNLVGNAWKYTARTADARISVSGERDSTDTVIHIRDNGAGFDMAHARMLFGAFQRLHAAREFEGTGIGLATVKRIVNRHGGRVWAEGAVAAGATFSLALPHVHDTNGRDGESEDVNDERANSAR